MIYTVEYLPLLWSLYTSNLFLLPSGADVFPYMNTIQYSNFFFYYYYFFNNLDCVIITNINSSNI